MQSKATTVDAYLEEVPDDRLPALLKLRELCLRHLTGFEESMAYGGPVYIRDGEIEVGFANQKNSINLYILRQDVMDAHRASFARSNVGKGCIRYRNPEKIDFDLVARMLVETAESLGPLC